MTIGWNHPVDESDQWDGFNEPGIEHFRSNPLLHLAREIIQNAIDADDGSGKIKVRFKLQEVETSSIPNLDELQMNLKHCLAAAKDESEKAQAYFKNAINKLSQNKIKVLEASDFNTHGMRGPSKNGTSFYAFVKAKGQSKKDGDTASGSYGIGKFAPYAASDIRTVFVSTIYQDDDGACKQLSQGKSILMSHDVDGDRREGIGFWGIKAKCQPVEGIADLPDWILRSTSQDDFCSLKGTKITILCFNDVSNWKDFLAVSVAENFFAAISENNLSVEIDDKYLLDVSSMNDFFLNHEVEKIINDAKLRGEPEQFKNAYNYYSTLQESPEIIVENKEHGHLGLCQLKIIVGENLPKKVCALRNGMFISDSINRLKQFNDYKEFVAVFQCLADKGKQLLRQMEPPRHDDFEPNLLPKEDVAKGKKSLNDIATWIRDMLKKHAKDPVSEVTSLDELKDFFGDDEGEGSGDGNQETNPLGKLTFRAKPPKVNPSAPKTTVASGEGATNGGATGDGATGDGENGEGGGGNGGAGGGDGMGGKGASSGGSGGSGEQRKSVDIENVRAIVSGSNKRKISLTPIKSGPIAISILEAGADSDYNAVIALSDVGELKNGTVIIDAKSGERVTLNICLTEDFNGAIKVVASEI